VGFAGGFCAQASPTHCALDSALHGNLGKASPAGLGARRPREGFARAAAARRPGRGFVRRVRAHAREAQSALDVRAARGLAERSGGPKRPVPRRRLPHHDSFAT
jgi:hypothetical protein